tara:strand:+ start:2900 stop:4180 length:1281 start_codon:yes stop_codon:yes gene_type:complete
MKQTIVISCPSTSRSGYGNHSRDLIRSLIKMNKYDIKIIDQRWGNCPKDALTENDSDIMELIATQPIQQEPDIWIQVTVPNEFMRAGKYNIGITAGIETDRVSPQWLEGMNRMDMNIVPSEHSVRGFTCTYDKMNQQTGEVVETLALNKPIEILMEGIDTSVFNKTDKIEPKIEKQLSSIKEDFNFLICGHWMNGGFTHDRKDIGGTLHTIITSFKNKSQKNIPGIILKTGIGFSVTERNNVIQKIKDVTAPFQDAKTKIPNIYLVWGNLTDSEMNSLYNHPKVKAMVSFTHGEGYGRPLAEFSITGKPVIVSDWSGHVDFIKQNGIMLPGELKQVHKSTVWKEVIQEDSQWFYVNYQYASGVIRDVYKNYKKYLEKTRKQTKYMKDNFTLDVMTSQFENILEKYLPAASVEDFEVPNLEELQTYE